MYCRCVFGLKRVLLQLAGDQAFAPFFDLNEKAHACRATGFLPLHAVVANSRDFGPLRDSIPPYYRFPTPLTPSYISTCHLPTTPVTNPFTALLGLHMFDFLTCKLPPELRADPNAKTPEDHLFGRLSPLTLAVKLGDSRAAELILKRRMKVLLVA